MRELCHNPNMPRQARVSVADVVYHIINRANEPWRSVMKFTDYLTKQRDAAQRLSEAQVNDVDRQNYEFCVRLCDELIKIVKPDVVLNDDQANFVALTVGNIGYGFLAGRDVKYKETPRTDPFLLMKLATYVNSCN